MKPLKLILPILFLSSLAFGQGSFASFTVQTPTGNAIAGASVALCTSLPTAATPCGNSTLQTTYVDITAAVQCTKNALVLGPLNGAGCTNPGYTDNFGNAQIFALGGFNYYQTWGYGIANTYVSPLPFPALTAGVGTINNVATINGLTGGGIGPSVSVGLITSCPANNVLLWNGSTWNCSTAGSGTLTGATTAGTSGLIGGGLTGTIALSMRTDCAATQTEVWSGTSWNCGANGTGTVTGVTATSGGGLVPGGTAQAPTLGLITSCGNNQVLQWNASSWVCATIAGGAGTPGGATTQVQVNNSGAFAGYSFLTVNSGTSTVNMTNGSVSNQFTVAGPHFINSTWPSSLPGVCAFGVGSCLSTTSFGFDQAGHLSELGFNNATGGGEYLLSNPAADQAITAKKFSVNNLSNIRYVTPSFNWLQSPAAVLTTPGVQTVTLTPCPSGVTGTDPNLWVYVAAQGTPEADLVTAGSCTPGAASGTIVFTTVNAHAAGYTVGSASAGIYEALRDATPSNNNNVRLILQPTNPPASVYYSVYAPITILGGVIEIEGGGTTIDCEATRACFVMPTVNNESVHIHHFRVGNRATYAGASITNTVCAANVATITTTLNPLVGSMVDIQATDNTAYWGPHVVATSSGSQWTYGFTGCSIASQATPGRNAYQNAFIETNSQGTQIDHIAFDSPGGFSGAMNNGFVVLNDQSFHLNDIQVVSPFSGCTATYCSNLLYAPGPFGTNAAVIYADHINGTLNCSANGFTLYNGNTNHILDTVIQGFDEWAFVTGINRGGFGPSQFDNVYNEVGNCLNPRYTQAGLSGNAARAMTGILAYSSANRVTGGEGPTGQMPQFAATGANTIQLYVVIKDSVLGASLPMYIGFASTNNAGTFTAAWPRVGSLNTITYDLLSTGTLGTGSGSLAIQVPYTTAGSCPGGTPSACGSIATAIAQCSGLVCTATVTPGNSTTAYTVPTEVAYFSPSFWPGSIVNSAYQNTSLFTNVAKTFADRTWSPGQLSPVISETRFAPTIITLECSGAGGWAWEVCENTMPGGSNATGATVLMGGIPNGGATDGLKGRLNFNWKTLSQGQIITLASATPDSDMATTGNRPLGNANDAYLGMDVVLGGQPTSVSQLAYGAAVSHSFYVGSLPDNTSWLERLTASLKTFKVPVVANSTLVVSSTFTGADANGLVFVDGTRFTNLCGAMAFAAANATRRSKIYDLNPYEAWTKDPFNDATCGNFASTNVSPQVYLGLGNFINGTGGTIHIPTGVELYLGGRASENQLSTSTGCGTATPTSCTGTLIIAYSTAAPFTGGNAMTCGSCTLFPINTPVIDFGSTGSFGTLIQGPGSISCAGVAGSTGIANAQAQEQSFLFHLAIVGCQAFAVDWNGSAAQNSWIDDLEILSGNLTGGTIGTPTAFIGVRISINAPTRHYGNFTCNTRGAATTLPVTACVKVINSRGGRVHDVHYENANYGVVVDGSSNVLLQNINTSAASVDASTPVALVKNCASGSSAPCTSGVSSSNLVVQGLQRTSPNITTNAVVDDNVTGGTITWANWTGEYNQAVPQFGAFPATVTVGSGTSTSNGTAIASGVSQAQPAITVTGATVTDVATCSLNAAPVATWQTGIQILAAVVTANTVTPWLSNPTAGSITPAATAIRCTVIR